VCNYLHIYVRDASPSGNRVPRRTAFSRSRLENESLPRISTCLWKWAGDGQMDGGGQRRDEPTRGLELRNEARSLSQLSRRRLGTPLRVDRWRIARPWAGLGAAACDMVLGGWSRRCGGQEDEAPLLPDRSGGAPSIEAFGCVKSDATGSSGTEPRSHGGFAAALVSSNRVIGVMSSVLGGITRNEGRG
jgi:hypothetical protein